MTHLDVSRLSPEHQAFIRKVGKATQIFKRPQPERVSRYGFTFDSKLEADFSDALQDWLLREFIVEWRYHPLKFRLAQNVTYEPDFCTWMPSGSDGDYPMSVYEVKGSWQAKNARDSRTRLQIAASLFPYWTWHAVTREDGEWHYETINPTYKEA